MPNKGKISCQYCTYSREHRGNTTFGICDIWGISCSPFLLCRSYREPQQSHREAKAYWIMLERLKPGIVYSINEDKETATDRIKPMYKIAKIEEESILNVSLIRLN